MYLLSFFEQHIRCMAKAGRCFVTLVYGKNLMGCQVEMPPRVSPL